MIESRARNAEDLSRRWLQISVLTIQPLKLHLSDTIDSVGYFENDIHGMELGVTHPPYVKGKTPNISTYTPTFKNVFCSQKSRRPVAAGLKLCTDVHVRQGYK